MRRPGPAPTPLSRRRALAALAAAGVAVFSRARGGSPGEDGRLADLGMSLDEAARARGEAFLARHVSVDMHCHAGRFFLGHLPYATDTTRAFGAPFEERAAADLVAGHVGGALLAGVSDMRLLELVPEGIHAAREFGPGEAEEDYARQLDELRSLVARGLVVRGDSAAAIRSAARHRRTAGTFAIEGGDFIEDRLERVAAARRAGVRAITIVHYHINQIGDIQTEAPVHGGLTPLGREIVRAMNAAGVIVDLAHATHEVTRDAVEASSRPMMISHTNLATAEHRHPRLVSTEHARLVAGAGGVIGSVPSGIFQASFADWIDSVFRLIDAVGIDHVGIGTDMDANYRPVFRSYRDWSLIPAALLARGLDEDAVARVMGGNFLRILEAQVS